MGYTPPRGLRFPVFPRLALVLLACVALLFAACGGGGGDEEGAEETSTAEATATASDTDGDTDEQDPRAPRSTATPTPTPTPGPVEPLTGELLLDASIMERPALMVKIDNSPRGRPQAGLNDADVIVEVRVESQITRLLGVFHSSAPDLIGPVRSSRSSDPDIAANFNQPVYVHSGGNSGVLSEVAQSDREGKLHNMRLEVPPNLGLSTRASDRAAPWNLFARSGAIWNTVPDDLVPPEQIFQYRSVTDRLPRVAERVPGVSITYIGGLETRFVWDEQAGGWARWQRDTPHLAADGEQLTPANLVVLRTRYVSSPSDPRSPQAVTVDSTGNGALIFTDGHLIRGTWTRDSAQEPWQIVDLDGNPVLLTPGQTFVALPGGDVVLMSDADARNLLDR